MNKQHVELISHKLCPYVQRSVIILTEKRMSFSRIDINLANKPDWFLALSPTGKVPLLKINDKQVIFESAVICEYLNEVTPNSLLADDPLERAYQRAWMDYGSGILGLIGNYYSAKEQQTFNLAEAQLRSRFERLEDSVVGPYFIGSEFSMVDAVYAPVFRYFAVFEQYLHSELFNHLPKLQVWRQTLMRRKSVQTAVADDYPTALIKFVSDKQSYLATRLQKVRSFKF